ncbi:MAG: EAL domain-containing protein [Ruminiclostridium sp.]|nr:EAL domain-containing protein [Ruminiclostridium sp.]
MSVYITCMEIWMIIRLLSRQLQGIDLRSTDYYISHYCNYAMLLAAAAVMLIFAVMYIRGKKVPQALGYVLKWAFMLICVSFGIEISAADYGKGEQVFTFLTMELFAACLLTWYPIFGFMIISVSYGIFYLTLDATLVTATGFIGATDATKINLFIMYVATLFCSFGNYARTASQARKAEELSRMNGRLEDIAKHDELTGIHNMLYFRAEAEKLLKTKKKSELTFLFLDIENFKSYNETYGFSKGNELLKRVAQMIDSAFSYSLSARFSDDHFVVLTASPGSEGTVSLISEKLESEDSDVQLHLKCGAYSPTESDDDPILACDRARFACNSIKKHFGKKYRVYDSGLEETYHLKRYVVNSIDTAVREEFLRVYYQPIMSAADDTVAGFEALARWDDPAHGVLIPALFITTLEEHRQIHKLDMFIIDRVCRDIRHRLDTGSFCPPVSVNLSRLDFELVDIVGCLCGTADRYHIPHSLIDVEITESALVGQKEKLKAELDRIRAEGFSILLDDFGSGYSTLNVLKEYRFDVLKIDMQFLEGFPDNPNTGVILENVLALAKSLGMTSLAEGVETEEQYAFLRRIGCEKVQGYMFSRPVPINQLDEKLLTGSLKPAKKEI